MINDRLNDFSGKKAKVFLKNNWKYEGDIICCDEQFLEIYDYKLRANKFLDISTIANIEIASDNDKEV